MRKFDEFLDEHVNEKKNFWGLDYHKWYPSASLYDDITEFESDREFQGVLWKFNNGDIEFDRQINVDGPKEMGRGKMIDSFMLISNK
jgi:hypothetical protein